MSAATMELASVVTGRQMMMFVVVGLHALVIGVLMTMRIDVDRLVVPIIGSITDLTLPEPVPEEKKPELNPTGSTYRWRAPDLPEYHHQANRDRAITEDAVPPVPPGPDVAIGSPSGNTFVIPPTDLISRAIRSPDDYYPSTSIHLQEEGVSTVRVCVGPTGRIEGTPSVKRGSGSRRLDTAALKWAGEALVFTPATRNGAAVSACREYRVVFQLR